MSFSNIDCKNYSMSQHGSRHNVEYNSPSYAADILLGTQSWLPSVQAVESSDVLSLIVQNQEKLRESSGKRMQSTSTSNVCPVSSDSECDAQKDLLPALVSNAERPEKDNFASFVEFLDQDSFCLGVLGTIDYKSNSAHDYLDDISKVGAPPTPDLPLSSSDDIGINLKMFECLLPNSVLDSFNRLDGLDDFQIETAMDLDGSDTVVVDRATAEGENKDSLEFPVETQLTDNAVHTVDHVDDEVPVEYQDVLHAVFRHDTSERSSGRNSLKGSTYQSSSGRAYAVTTKLPMSEFEMLR